MERQAFIRRESLMLKQGMSILIPAGHVRHPRSRYRRIPGDQDPAEGPLRRNGTHSGMGLLLQPSEAQEG